MRIPSFEIRSERSIRLAKCDKVPALMLIAGPNGAGKTTLLDYLRRKGSTENIIYLGPHRAMRRQQVQHRHLISNPLRMEQILATSEIMRGFEGVAITHPIRDPWSYDDASNHLKHALCQVEIERTQAIASRFDRAGEIPKGSIPDPWTPLRELSHHLLPHLNFEKIDVSNPNEIRCLWNVHNSGVMVDLDELSSGEKSVIQMFYPLIEREIRNQLETIQGLTPAKDRPENCILIDEPELHLHPNLQVKVLDYLRLLTSGKGTQVILTTQSPTMVEHANFEELYLLRPPELVQQEENQLIQIADNEERLRVLRDLFGGTSNLTAMQPIIIVESVNEKEATKSMPDRKLYRALHSGFDSVSLISGGGKSQCKALLPHLQEALSTFSSRLQVIALLDKDYAEQSGDLLIHLLPVSMIENFLLDPDVIWQAIESVFESTKLKTVSDVLQALNILLDETEPQEIERRVVHMLGMKIFRPHIPINNIGEQVRSAIDELNIQFSQDRIQQSITRAGDQIAALKLSNRRQEEFHGKTILNEFYKRFLHNTSLSRDSFKYYAAKRAGRRKSVEEYFDGLFASLSQL